MDFLGIFATLAAVGVAPFIGLHLLLAQMWKSILTSGDILWKQFREWYVIAIGEYVIKALLFTALSHLALLGLMVCIAGNDARHWSSLKWPAGAAALSIGMELIMVLWQLPALPKLLPGRYPDYVATTAGNLLGKDGTPLIINGHNVTLNQHGIPTAHGALTVDHELLLPHWRAGKRKYDETKFRPERLQTGWSIVLIIAMFLINASAAAFAAAQLRSMPLMLVYMLNLAFAYLPLFAVGKLLDWAQERGITLAEFAGTLGIRQVLPLALGITVANSPKLELLNQGSNTERIDGFLNSIFVNFGLMTVWSLAIPHPSTLLLVPLTLIFLAVPAAGFTAVGGGFIVKQRLRRLMNINSFAAPIVGITSAALRYLPDDGFSGEIKIATADRWGSIIDGFILGMTPPAVSASWDVIGSCVFMGAIATVTLWIAHKVVTGSPSAVKKITSWVMAPVGILALLWCLGDLVDIGYKIAGKEAITPPWGISQAAAAEINKKREKEAREKQREEWRTEVNPWVEKYAILSIYGGIGLKKEIEKSLQLTVEAPAESEPAPTPVPPRAEEAAPTPPPITPSPVSVRVKQPTTSPRTAPQQATQQPPARQRSCTAAYVARYYRIYGKNPSCVAALATR